MLVNTNTLALKVNKRGRQVVIGKLVTAQPLEEYILATPYKNRKTVGTVSIPTSVLKFALQQGAMQWVVRLDLEGTCYAIPLEYVRRIGWLKSSYGIAEFFIPLTEFKPIPWQDWPYVERTKLVEPGKPDQLSFAMEAVIV